MKYTEEARDLIYNALEFYTQGTQIFENYFAGDGEEVGQAIIDEAYKIVNTDYSNEVHKVFRWIDAEMEEAKDDDGGIEWDTQIEIYEEALVEIGKIVRNENN